MCWNAGEVFSVYQRLLIHPLDWMLGVVKAHPLIVDWIWGSTWFVFVVFVAGQPHFINAIAACIFRIWFHTYVVSITIYYICHFDMFWLFISPFFHHYIIYHAYTSTLFTYICTYAYTHIYTQIHLIFACTDSFQAPSKVIKLKVSNLISRRWRGWMVQRNVTFLTVFFRCPHFQHSVFRGRELGIPRPLFQENPRLVKYYC